jgi:methyl halide transferase
MDDEKKSGNDMNEASASLQLDADYWSNRYNAGTDFWNLGEVSPPIKKYIGQVADKNLRILIPGCGNTYEADYLLQQGFTNVTVIDIAPVLVALLKKKHKDNPNIKIILGDFFKHTGEYDLILEQTFFCAIDPALRNDYATKMPEMLATDGKLVGVLFNRVFEEQGPPFGGSKNEYETMFENFFHLKTFEHCYNSFPKRKDTELFINLVKK